MSTEIRTGAALPIVDAQLSVLQRESWSASSDPEVAVRIGRLVDHLHALRPPPAWGRCWPRGCSPGTQALLRG
ncbi:hypothetical protein [Nocardiopsis sp. SBT366]|uniref:hypothetical protein n=1 Tax=Nocardiopsis sp. SBT366 TaxID=1580529 RepID=UPI0009E3F0FC|nr:hypothetical protein [Nocardiopsis sp. SBT366]